MTLSWGNDPPPVEAVSVTSLHSAASTIRRVANGAPHLDPRVAAELLSVSANLDVIADRGVLIERIHRDGGA